MAVDFLVSEVISNKKLNSKFNLISLRLRHNKESFVFEPGQFVVIKAPASTYRNYSIASIPSKMPYWQILLDKTPNGPGSIFLKNLQPGQTIQHSKAKGIFTFKQSSAVYTIFAATGCGLASIIPMAEELLKKPKHQVQLFWGLRNEKDLCLTDWFKSLSNNPRFNYHIILSKPSALWKGGKGYITDPLIKFVKTLPQNKADIYLCGRKEMINDIKSKLQTSNFAENRIYFERY